MARRVLRGLLFVAVAGYCLVALALLSYRFVNPPFTAIQLERKLSAWGRGAGLLIRQNRVPLGRISPNLQHAVIAAEDGKFYTHWGFDFDQLEIAVTEDLPEKGRLRGASTISQQLVKNLFFSTRGSFVRKGAEAATTPLAEVLLGKQRILELYLNEVEWGPGVFGAEAAARYHFRRSAASLSREQAARLAAILPAPRTRKPARMNRYSAIIQQRMAQMGW